MTNHRTSATSANLLFLQSFHGQKRQQLMSELLMPPDSRAESTRDKHASWSYIYNGLLLCLFGPNICSSNMCLSYRKAYMLCKYWFNCLQLQVDRAWSAVHHKHHVKCVNMSLYISMHHYTYIVVIITITGQTFVVAIMSHFNKFPKRFLKKCWFFLNSIFLQKVLYVV
jgi:hypothetical protein